MLLGNEQTSYIKVNKNLNNNLVHTHIRSQTNNILKSNIAKKINNNNNQSLSQLKIKKVPKLSIKTNNSIYMKKNINFSKNKCPTHRLNNISSLITEINNNENDYKDNIGNIENVYNKTLSNLTHIKLQSQNILTQKNENLKEGELNQEAKCKKIFIKNKNYKNYIERTRSGKKKNTQKSSPADSIVSSFDEKNNNNFNKNVEEKKLNDILKSTKFNNNINEHKEQKMIRSIDDIKKECLATMKISEKVQSRINNEGNKLMNSLQEKYLKLTGKEEISSNISSTFSTPCEQRNIFPFNYFQLQENINNINLGTFSINYNNLNENYKLFNNNNVSIEEYSSLINTLTFIEYGQTILEEYYIEEEHLNNILINHSITPYMRMKMVDWMIEIFTTIPTKQITFFICVNIMDRFFYYSKKQYKGDDLHLIGICSIFLAFKYSEAKPIKLSFLVEKIAHNKFNKNDIIAMEEEILNVLNFNLLKPTLYEFTSLYFRDIFYCPENFYNIKNIILRNQFKEYIENYHIDLDANNDNENILNNKYYDKWAMLAKYNDNMRKYVKSLVVYLMMMCIQDYEFACEKKSIVASAIIFVAMKISEEVNKEKYIDDYLIEKLMKLSKDNKYNIIEMSSRILTRIQNYEKYYKGISNLYNIYFRKLSQMKDTK